MSLWPPRGRRGPQLEGVWWGLWLDLSQLIIHKHCSYFFSDCKYTVHERCVSKNIPGCVKTYSKTKKGREVGDTYYLVLLHAAPQATCPSPQIPWQEGPLGALSSPFSASRTTLKSSHSSINAFSISLVSTMCQALC